MIKTKKQFLAMHCHDFDRWSIVATEDCWKIVEIEEDCWNTINMDHIATCATINMDHIQTSKSFMTVELTARLSKTSKNDVWCFTPVSNYSN